MLGYVVQVQARRRLVKRRKSTKALGLLEELSSCTIDLLYVPRAISEYRAS